MICGVCRCGRISLRLGRRGLRIPRVRARIDHARRASATQRVSASRSASGVPSHACAARYLCLCDWCLLGLGAQRASDAGSTHRVSRGPAIATAIVPSLCAAIGSCCGSAACPCECTRVCRVGRILFFTIRDRYLARLWPLLKLGSRSQVPVFVLYNLWEKEPGDLVPPRIHVACPPARGQEGSGRVHGRVPLVG